LHAKQGGARCGEGDSTVDRSAVIAHGSVRPVAVGELNRHTSRVVGSLGEGERLVVTRHGDPVAVVLSVRDSIEILAAPSFAALAEAAAQAFASDEVFDPCPGVGPWRIVLPREFEREYGRLGGLDRGGLRRALCCGEADPGRPVWLPTGKWLAPVSYPEDRIALVHALIETRGLEREVIGEEVWRARLRRDLDRHSHARAPWQREPPAAED